METSDGGETAKSMRTVDVCMKIQYPGVARSIHSDIDNLMRLVSLTDLLPRGLYVEHAVKVAKAGAQRGRGDGGRGGGTRYQRSNHDTSEYHN